MNKNILLLVTGMSPQVVTETIYGLAVSAPVDQRWIPHEIHVISTTTGLEQARLQLLEGPQYFQQLVTDYQLPKIRFELDCLHQICNAEGQPLKDLKTPADNELAANTICELIRRFTLDSHTTLHVSIAGGRKTMGFYAGYALSLYGRPQDRLSHVLVSDDFEGLKDFYYPTPRSKTVYNRKEQAIDASKAQVWLANIPFVRLRSYLKEADLVQKASFSEVVESINLASEPLSISLNTTQKTINVNGKSCKLPPREFGFYHWFAELAKFHPLNTIHCPVDGENREEKRFYELWKGIDNLEAHESTVIDKPFFEQRLSELKRKLKQELGPDLTKKIVPSFKKRGAGYQLMLSPNQIKIVQ